MGCHHQPANFPSVWPFGNGKKKGSFTVSRISGSLWDIKLWEIFSCICFWKILPKILGVIDWGFRLGGGCWWWVGLRDWLIWFFSGDDYYFDWFSEGGGRGERKQNSLRGVPLVVLWVRGFEPTWIEEILIDCLIDWLMFRFQCERLVFFNFSGKICSGRMDTWVTLMLPTKPWGVSSFKFVSAGVQKTNSCFMKLAI